MTLTQINKAGLDELALDHVFTIGASGTDHYTFQGEGLNGTVNDPTLYLTRGKTYRFENGTGSHPIRIQSTSGASGTAYNTGVTNNAGSGTVIVEVQHDAPDVLYYQCTSHANMNGILYITGALADGGVTTAKLADDAVTDAKLANSINTAIAANTAKTSNATHTGDVTGSTSLTIANDAITTSKINANAVTTVKINDNAVTTAKIQAANVTTAKIADDAVTAAKIADNSVTSAQIVANAVVTNNIVDEAVTLAKLPHGTSSNDGKFLRANNGADPSFETITGTTINNNADNRVITGSGTANTLNGESNVVIDSSGNLGVGLNSPTSRLNVKSNNHYVVTNDGKSNQLHINGAYGNSGEFGGSLSLGTTSSSAAAIAARQYSSTAHQLGLSFFTHPTTTQTDNSEEKLRIHADGRIQPMYSSTAPATGGVMTVGAFNAKLNGHEPEGLFKARTDVSNQSVFDSAGWYDNTNFRYVPKVKGYYIFHVTMMFFTGMSGGSVEQSFQIRLNGSTVHGYTDGYSTNYGNYSKHSFHGVIRCNGNTDYVDVNAYSSASTQLHSASNWSGWLLYPDS